MNYDFPGNVRELRNLLERALVLCRGLKITPADLPAEINRLEDSGDDCTLSSAVARAELECLKRALSSCDGNRTQASKILGISRKNLWEKMKLYDIE
jgi:two-component system response regulator AtoC